MYVPTNHDGVLGEFLMPRFFLLVDSCRVLLRGFSNQRRVREGDRQRWSEPSSSAHRSSTISSFLFLCFFVESSNPSTSLSRKGRSRTGGNMLICYTRISHHASPTILDEYSYSGTWFFNLQIISLQNSCLTLRTNDISYIS
jgi:hypothetical protein